jgi:hypothetical protein
MYRLLATAYRLPFGLPLRWQDEQSGELSRAIEAYLDNRISGETVTDAQITLVRDYIVYYIDAPCWNQEEFVDELRGLRSSARELDSATEISEWIGKAMDIGLDPL